MSEYFIQSSTLTSIADAIREKHDTTDSIAVTDMATMIQDIPNRRFPNGTKWTQSNITDVGFRGVSYANGIWVAAAALIQDYNDIYPLFYYSTDGKEWTPGNVKGDQMLGAIFRYGNGTWVAATEHQGIYYSADGKTWSDSDKDFGYTYGLDYANGIWVAAGDTGLLYSTDGKTWNKSNMTTVTQEYISVHYANGIWVAGTSLGTLYSTDGKTWSYSNITVCGSAIHYANGIWVTGDHSGDGTGFYYSTDGKTWNQSNITSGYLNAVYYANGTWVACSEGDGLRYSSDGKTWFDTNFSGYQYSVYYANGVWVMGFCNGLWYSTDGKIWYYAWEGDYDEDADLTPGFWPAEALYNANGIWVAANNAEGLWYSVTWEP